MTELISWETAASVATRVARRQEPLTPEDRRVLEADFGELTAQAEDLVAAETGLRSLAGPARAWSPTARSGSEPTWRPSSDCCAL